MSTLHVTNGDAVGGTLIEAGFADAVLPWRDVLHDGPVPAGLDAEALRNLRAQFLSSRGWTSFELALADLAGRDAQLAACGASDNLVLWFEPDLYDQLQLLQILARLYLRPLVERPAITIVAADELLGPLPADKLAKYAGKQRVVREVDLELAATAWEAFTHSDTSLLSQYGSPLLTAQSYASDTDIVLPHIQSAFTRLLEEHPSPSNGLSRTEQQTLEVLAAAPKTAAETYRAVQAKEAMVWLGDWSFAWYLERLMIAKHPLVERADGDVLQPGSAQREGMKFWEQTVRITAAGRAVLSGEQNAVVLNGIDRWIGGVHLRQDAA